MASENLQRIVNAASESGLEGGKQAAEELSQLLEKYSKSEKQRLEFENDMDLLKELFSAQMELTNSLQNIINRKEAEKIRIPEKIPKKSDLVRIDEQNCSIWQTFEIVAVYTVRNQEMPTLVVVSKDARRVKYDLFYDGKEWRVSQGQTYKVHF